MRVAIGSELQNVKIRKRSTEAGRWNSMKKASMAVIMALLITLCCGIFGSFLSSAHSNREEEPVNFKYYKSITIEQGDTLWGIAEEYMTDDYDSIEEYVYALKMLNKLDGDTIKAGDKIVIAYNNTEFMK